MSVNKHNNLVFDNRTNLWFLNRRKPQETWVVALLCASMPVFLLLLPKHPLDGLISGVLIIFNIVCLFYFFKGVDRIEFSTSNRSLRVTQSRLLSTKLKVHEFSFDQFQSVSSNIVDRGDTKVNQVVLMPHPGGKGLILGNFKPARIEVSFFSSPDFTGENSRATDLREKIASLMGLTNAGYRKHARLETLNV